MDSLSKLSTYISNKPYIPEKNIPEDQINALFNVITTGNVDKIRSYVLKNNGVINVRSSNGETPLHILLKQENITDKDKFICAKYLIVEGGAPIDLYDSNNISPLHYACKFQLYDVVKLLLEHGADVNHQDNKNMTPIHYLLLGYNVECPTSDKKIISSKDANNTTFYNSNLENVMGDLYNEIENYILEDEDIKPYLEHIFNNIYQYDQINHDKFKPIIDSYNDSIPTIIYSNKNTEDIKAKISEKVKSTIEQIKKIINDDFIPREQIVFTNSNDRTIEKNNINIIDSNKLFLNEFNSINSKINQNNLNITNSLKDFFTLYNEEFFNNDNLNIFFNEFIRGTTYDAVLSSYVMTGGWGTPTRFPGAVPGTVPVAPPYTGPIPGTVPIAMPTGATMGGPFTGAPMGGPFMGAPMGGPFTGAPMGGPFMGAPMGGPFGTAPMGMPPGAPMGGPFGTAPMGMPPGAPMGGPFGTAPRAPMGMPPGAPMGMPFGTAPRGPMRMPPRGPFTGAPRGMPPMGAAPTTVTKKNIFISLLKNLKFHFKDVTTRDTIGRLMKRIFGKDIKTGEVITLYNSLLNTNEEIQNIQYDSNNFLFYYFMFIFTEFYSICNKTKNEIRDYKINLTLNRYIDVITYNYPCLVYCLTQLLLVFSRLVYFMNLYIDEFKLSNLTTNADFNDNVNEYNKLINNFYNIIQKIIKNINEINSNLGKYYSINYIESFTRDFNNKKINIKDFKNSEMITNVFDEINVIPNNIEEFIKPIQEYLKPSKQNEISLAKQYLIELLIPINRNYNNIHIIKPDYTRENGKSKIGYIFPCNIVFENKLFKGKKIPKGAPKLSFQKEFIIEMMKKPLTQEVFDNVSKKFYKDEFNDLDFVNNILLTHKDIPEENKELIRNFLKSKTVPPTGVPPSPLDLPTPTENKKKEDRFEVLSAEERPIVVHLSTFIKNENTLKDYLEKKKEHLSDEFLEYLISEKSTIKKENKELLKNYIDNKKTKAPPTDKKEFTPNTPQGTLRNRIQMGEKTEEQIVELLNLYKDELSDEYIQYLLNYQHLSDRKKNIIREYIESKKTKAPSPVTPPIETTFTPFELLTDEKLIEIIKTDKPYTINGDNLTIELNFLEAILTRSNEFLNNLLKNNEITEQHKNVIQNLSKDPEATLEYTKNYIKSSLKKDLIHEKDENGKIIKIQATNFIALLQSRTIEFLKELLGDSEITETNKVIIQNIIDSKEKVSDNVTDDMLAITIIPKDFIDGILENIRNSVLDKKEIKNLLIRFIDNPIVITRIFDDESIPKEKKEIIRELINEQKLINEAGRLDSPLSTPDSPLRTPDITSAVGLNPIDNLQNTELPPPTPELINKNIQNMANFDINQVTREMSETNPELKNTATVLQQLQQGKKWGDILSGGGPYHIYNTQLRDSTPVSYFNTEILDDSTKDNLGQIKYNQILLDNDKKYIILQILKHNMELHNQIIKIKIIENLIPKLINKMKTDTDSNISKYKKLILDTIKDKDVKDKDIMVSVFKIFDNIFNNYIKGHSEYFSKLYLQQFMKDETKRDIDFSIYNFKTTKSREDVEKVFPDVLSVFMGSNNDLDNVTNPSDLNINKIFFEKVNSKGDNTIHNIQNYSNLIEESQEKCYKLDVSILDLFKNKKVKYDLRDSSKHTPLFYAIKLLNTELIEKLVEKSSVNTDNVKINGVTPLRYTLNLLYNHLNVLNQTPKVNFKFTDNLGNILNEKIQGKINNKIKLNTIQYIYKFLTSMLNHNFLLRSKQFKKRLEKITKDKVDLEYSLINYFNKNIYELKNINGDKILSEHNESIKFEKQKIKEKLDKLNSIDLGANIPDNIKNEIDYKKQKLNDRLSKLKEYELGTNTFNKKLDITNNIRSVKLDYSRIDSLYLAIQEIIVINRTVDPLNKFDSITYVDLFNRYLDSDEAHNTTHVHLLLSNGLQTLLDKNSKTLKVKDLKDELTKYNKYYESVFVDLINDYEELPEYSTDNINPILYDTIFIIKNVLLVTIIMPMYYTILKYIQNMNIKKGLDIQDSNVQIDFILNKSNKNGQNVVLYVLDELPTKLIKKNLNIYEYEDDPAKKDKNNTNIYLKEILEYMKGEISDELIAEINKDVIEYYSIIINTVLPEMKIYCDNYYKYIKHEAKLIKITELILEKANNES